jgi:hypothetical protein
MISTAKIEANRRNAKLSTGPRTSHGKNRSRFNALKHGMAAQLPVLPGEDAEAFERQRDGWFDDLRPRTAVEYFFAERAVRLAWQLGRLDRADAARLSFRIQTHGADQNKSQQDEAVDLGQRLFWDPRGPLAVYPHSELPPGGVRVSWSGILGDPDHPALLRRRLESTRAGCRWLIDRWAELGSLLERQAAWHAPERFKVIRLLGKQPLEALHDRELATMLQACHVLDPDSGEPFSELWHELLPAEAAVCQRRLQAWQVDLLPPADAAAARQVLLELVGRETARLKARARRQRRRANLEDELAVTRLAFDDTPAGERFRRYEMWCHRSLLRLLGVFTHPRHDNRNGHGFGSPRALLGTTAPAWYPPPGSRINSTGATDSFEPTHAVGPIRETGLSHCEVTELVSAILAEEEAKNLENEATAEAAPEPISPGESPAAGEATSEIETSLAGHDLRPDTAPAPDGPDLAERVTAVARRILQNEPTADVFAGTHQGGRGVPAGNRASRRRDRARRGANVRREIDELIAPAAPPAASARWLRGVSLRPHDASSRT